MALAILIYPICQISNLANIQYAKIANVKIAKAKIANAKIGNAKYLDLGYFVLPPAGIAK